MKILHLDTNHSLLLNQLKDSGFINDEDYTSSKQEIATKIHNYDGFIIRSRFKIDKNFLYCLQEELATTYLTYLVVVIVKII